MKCYECDNEMKPYWDELHEEEVEEVEYGYRCVVCDRKVFKVAEIVEPYELFEKGLKGKALKTAGNHNPWAKAPQV